MHRAPPGARAAPDPGAWRAVEDPYERLRRGLTELYGYYADNESMLWNVIRDAGATMMTIRDVLAAELPARRSPELLVTLDSGSTSTLAHARSSQRARAGHCRRADGVGRALRGLIGPAPPRLAQLARSALGGEPGDAPHRQFRPVDAGNASPDPSRKGV